MAALFAITVPFIIVPGAMLTNPSTFQNTLQASAPLVNFTFEDAAVERPPDIRKIKTAFGFDWPFKIRSRLRLAAPEIEYTPAVRICPFPKSGAGKKPG